jgi:hypothetical protein
MRSDMDIGIHVGPPFRNDEDAAATLERQAKRERLPAAILSLW